jgi:DNA gyrase subunit A
VRGIKLEEGDHVISMSILRHVDVETAERIAYIRMSRKRRGGEEEAAGEAVEEEAAETAETVTLTPERFASLEAVEEFILTVTAKGFGKRSSAYEYRITGRGGQGIAAIEMSDRNGQAVASFPVGHRDQIMLVTDRGQLIRCPVTDIRIAGRKTQGVVLFKVEEGEKVVSVTRLSDETPVAEGANGNGEEGPAPDA